MLRLICRQGTAGMLRRGGGGSFNVRRMMSTINSTSPWLMLPPTSDRSRGGMVYNFYSLADDEVVLVDKYGGGADPVEAPDDDARVVGSSHGWLALMNRRNNDLFLSNPLSRRHIKLPPIDALPHPEFNLRRGLGRVSKVILSASPERRDCRAVMSFGPGDRLAFCSPGRGGAWTPIGDLFVEIEDDDTKYGRVYEDLVYSSRTNVFNCLAVSNEDDVFEDWDLRASDAPKIDWTQTEKFPTVEACSYQCLPEVERFGYKWLDDERAEELRRCSTTLKHLVYIEEIGELFLLFRYMKKGGATAAFTVARVDKGKGGKVRLVGCELEGFAVFVGTNHSFALPAAEFPRLKPNSVYFTDHKINYTRFDGYFSKDFEGGDVGIFNCRDGTLSPCYHPLKGSTVPAPIWFTPSLP